MITEEDLQNAFLGGAGEPQQFRSYEGWRSWYFTCQDCRQDLSKEDSRTHHCPARNPPHPYRQTGAR
jgi:hypothetical protein